jgi:hypothetical protein
LALTRWCAAGIIALLVTSAAPSIRAQPIDLPPAVPESVPDLPDNPIPSQGQTSSTTSSGVQTPAPPATAQQSGEATQEEQRQKAEEQLKQQEKQRVFGVMATFNTTRNKDAVPLTAGQKYRLFFKSATDPWPFLLTAAGAGIDQAEDSFPAYGQGMEGYAKRWGAGYADYFTGNLLGNAVLAAMFKEDPRYFQKGTGSKMSRFLWAASSTVWCKRDNGTWGPNYANVLGNLMGAAVSNVYYPEADRTASGTIGRGVTVTAQAIIGSEVIEFWPDMVRNHRRKQAEKLAKQLGQDGARTPPAPHPQTPAAPPQP